MKKKGLVSIALAAMCLTCALVVAGCSTGQNAGNDQQNQNQAQTQPEKQAEPEKQTQPEQQAKPEAQPTPTPAATITAEDAKAVAFADASLAEADVWDLDVEQGTENGVNVWEVDFKYNGYEYEYDINASTSEIVKHRVEVDD